MFSEYFDDWQGAFSFDEFFKSLVADVLPEEDSKLPDGSSQGFGNGSLDDGSGKGNGILVGQPFAEAAVPLPLCRDARSELVELCYKVRKNWRTFFMVGVSAIWIVERVS